MPAWRSIPTPTGWCSPTSAAPTAATSTGRRSRGRACSTKATSSTSAAPSSGSAAATPAPATASSRPRSAPSSPRSARRSASSSSPTSRSSSPCSAARACRRRCSRSSTPATAGSSPTSCSAAASTPTCRRRRCTCSAWRARLGRAAELSLALRNHGVAAVASKLRGATLFVNAHPTETALPEFVPGIARLVREHPGIELVIEIHETAVVETARMRELGDRLADIGVRFAYDDFGAGQARLNELSEAPPHFVKFDMALVNGLASAGARKQRVIARPGPPGDRPRLDRPGRRDRGRGRRGALPADGLSPDAGLPVRQARARGQPVEDRMQTLPTYDDVAAAAARIARAAHRTPVLHLAHRRRGARRAASSSSARTSSAWAPSSSAAPSTRCRASTRAQRAAGVVAFSSGNHAQAIALSARLLGMPATIVMPHDAPAAKVAATTGYGGEVVIYDRYREDREAIGRRLAEEARPDADPALRPSRRHRRPGHGRQGAVRGGRAARRAVRLPRRRRPALRLGAGGARAGAGVQGLRRRARSRQRRPAVVSQRRASSTSTCRRRSPTAPRPSRSASITFEIIRRDVDDILTASDAELVEAMRFFAERMKMIVEPTGCLGFAAARADDGASSPAGGSASSSAAATSTWRASPRSPAARPSLRTRAAAAAGWRRRARRSRRRRPHAKRSAAPPSERRREAGCRRHLEREPAVLGEQGGVRARRQVAGDGAAHPVRADPALPARLLDHRRGCAPGRGRAAPPARSPRRRRRG